MSPWRRSDGPAVVSYRLARQQVLAALASGDRTPEDVCDAQPELRRVAHHHAFGLDERCPLCDDSELVAVLFAFGSGLPASGRVVADNRELASLGHRDQPVTCYLIEVCRRCWWNHLRESFEVGGSPAASSAG